MDTNQLKWLVVLIVTLVGVAVIMTGAILFYAYLSFIVATVAGLLLLGVIVTFVVTIAHKVHPFIEARHARQIERERLQLEREAQHERIAMEQSRHTQELALLERQSWLEEHLALTRLPANIYVPTQDGYQYLPEQRMPSARALPARASVREEDDTDDVTRYIGDGVRQPTQKFLISQLEQDMLQVCPGVYGRDGRPLVLSIPDAVHFKLIGSSGFGKSCLAGSMLDQALTTNSPDVLQVALLDLEHKTSRLFEHSPNVATFDVGRRRVQMVATNADEVAVHLGYLKKELDRRASLSEYELEMSEPLLLIYVEEMLSLQYEVDERLIEQMLKDLSILALRGRKYNMFLLACAQTDYSTPELKNAQKQFSTRIAFAVPQTAARAAGFQSAELIRYNFTHAQKGDGQFVLETPGVASLMLAPVFNVKEKVLACERRVNRRAEPVYEPHTSPSLHIVESENTGPTQAQHTANTGSHTRATHPLQAKLEQVAQLKALNWGKIKIIEKIWDCKHGTNKKYKDAEAEYEAIMSQLEVQEA